jgi:serine/threonine-protein kinase RsbT
MKWQMNLNSIQIDILSEADQARALVAVQGLATSIGFSTTSIAAITTAVSELVRNILKYAGKGHVRFDPARANGTKGLKITVPNRPWPIITAAAERLGLACPV